MADQTGFVVPGIRRPELEGVLQYGLIGVVETGDLSKKVVGQDVCRPEHPGAAHQVSLLGRAAGIQAAAEILGQDVNLLSGEVAIPDQVDGGGQRGNSTADEVSGDVFT